MRLPLKTIGVTIGALIGVLVLAVVLFIAFFPKEWAVAEAERRIEAATHRDLTIGGEVQLSFWPALGFSAEQASLSNPEGFDQQTPFLAADRIVFAVAVTPLFRGDIQVKQLIFEGAEVRLEAKHDGVANWAFPTEENSTEQTTIEDLRLDDVRFTDGMISFQGGDDAPPLTISNLHADLALNSLDAPAELKADFTYRDASVDLTSEIGLPRAILEQGETPLTAQIRAAALSADFEGGFNAATGALVGRLAANGDSLRRLMAWTGSPMAEGGGFGPYRLAATMSQLEQTIELTDAVINLDDIEARGRLTLLTLDDARMRVTGALTTANVDLNTYLPAPAQGAQTAGVEVDTSWSNDPLDLSGLRAMDADLDLSIGALKFQQMSFTDVTMALRIAGGAADARLSRISLYGGGAARLIADGSGPTPRIAVELATQNIQAETLLRDAIGFDKIAGRGQLAASLVGQGASQAALMRSLRGAASFTFNDGQWKGVNLAQIARTVQSLASGAAPAAGGAAAATDFAELAASFQIASGVAATDNLRLLNPFVRLDGQGLIDIGAQTLDMRIAPRAVQSIQGQGGDAAVAGLGIPFRVSGPWARVSFRPALGDVVQNELRNRASDLLRNQDQTNPLTQLGESLFGVRPQTPARAAEQPAQPAAQTEQPPADPPAEKQRTPEEQARDAIGGLFRRNN